MGITELEQNIGYIHVQLVVGRDEKDGKERQIEDRRSP